MEQAEKELIKYARPAFNNIIGGIISAALFIFIGSRSYSDTMFFVIWSLGGIFCLVYMVGFEYIIPYVRLVKKIKEIRQRTDYPVLINDFQKAGRAFDGTLILGDKFIIAKDSGSVYSYDEITRMYQVIVTTSGVEIQRKLYIYDRNNKKIRLCAIRKNHYHSEEMQGIYSYVISKNNNIRFGEL